MNHMLYDGSGNVSYSPYSSDEDSEQAPFEEEYEDFHKENDE